MTMQEHIDNIYQALDRVTDALSAVPDVDWNKASLFARVQGKVNEAQELLSRAEVK